MSTETPNYTALTLERVATLDRETQGKITLRVEALRQHRGLSIRRLADEIAMNYSSLSHRLQGRAPWTISDVMVFRRRFGVDLMEDL